MTRESILIVLGILVALSPWSGLPFNWLMYALIVVGLAVAAIGWTLRERRIAQSAAPVTAVPELPVEIEKPEPVQEPETQPLPVQEEPVAPAPEPAPFAPPPRPRRSIDLPSRASRIAKF